MSNSTSSSSSKNEGEEEKPKPIWTTAAYPAMIETAKSILKNGRSHEIDSKLMSIKNILDLIPGTN